MNTLASRSSLLIRLLGGLALFLTLWACNVESPEGTPVKEIRFNSIADSLRNAGYSHIEISAIREGMSAPVILYSADLAPGENPGALVLPDSLGTDFTITVKATKPVDKVYTKVYTISEGALSGTPVVTPPKEDTAGQVETLPNRVVLAPESLSLAEGGDTARLYAAVLPEEAPQGVLWSSSDASVATVDERGLVRSGAPGKASITARSQADASKSAVSEVSVFPLTTVAGVVVTPETLRVYLGGVAQPMQASMLPADIPVLVDWRSSAPGVATVSADGKVAAVSVGEAIISAHAKGDESKSDSCRVTVVRDVPKLSAGEDITVDAGTTVTFTPVVEQEYGGVAEFRWSLDGDTVWDGSAAAIPADLSRKYADAGTYQAYFWVKDGEGNEATARRRIQVQAIGAPVVTIDSPRSGEYVRATPIVVRYKVNGVSLQKSFSLAEGENTLTVDTVVNGVKGSASVAVVLDTKPPVVVITSPAEETATNKTSIAVAWTVDGKAQTALLTEALAADGEHLIIRESTDSAGNKGSDTVKVIRDTQPPVVVITSPAAGSKVTASPVTVAWTVDGKAQTAQTSETLSAGDGEKTITRIGTDAAGNTSTVSIKIILDKDKPGAPVMSTAVSPTSQASVVWKWQSGGNGNGIFRYRVDNPDLSTGAVTVSAAQVSISGLADGTHTLYLQERDDEGNWSASASQAIVVDRTAPVISIDGGNQTVASAAFTVSAAVSDANGLASVTVSGASAGDGAMTLSGTKYAKAVTLKLGANVLNVQARDVAGNQSTSSVSITYALPAITITSPVDGFVTSNGAITVSYKVGSSSTVKTKDVVLADGAQTVTISETGAQSASIQVYVYSNVVFVRKGAAAGGDGTSWDKAFNDLAAALRSTAGKKSGNKLWISAGTYSSSDEGTYGFHEVSLGVSLYGGFPATGRPFTEAGRNFTANKTILTCGVTWGGILRLAGNSTVDGIVFNQQVLGPQTIYVSISAIFINCVFQGTQQPNDFVYTNQAITTFDKCTFSAAASTGALINVWGGSTSISNSSFTNNSCRYLVYLDGQEVSLSNTTISGNTSWDTDIPFPAFKIWNGSLRNLGGNVSDKALLQP